MARRGLTALQVENAKPAAKRREIPDHGQRGLALVVQPSGAKSWCVRYRRASDRKSRKLTLPFVSLGAARKMAQEALDAVANGGDPAGSRRRRAPRYLRTATTSARRLSSFS
jgi:hypothetical protein